MKSTSTPTLLGAAKKPQSVVQTFPAIDLPQHSNYCVSQPTPPLELLPDANKDPSEAKRDRYCVIAPRDASQLLPRRNLWK